MKGAIVMGVALGCILTSILVLIEFAGPGWAVLAIATGIGLGVAESAWRRQERS